MSTTLIIIIVVIAFLLLLCFLLAIANFAYEKFFDSYKVMDNESIDKNMSSIDFFNFLNNKYFAGKISIVTIQKLGFDAYSNKTLYLSTNTQSNSSVASFSIIAHEMGHAMQDKNSKKLKHFSFLKYFGKILGFFLMPLFIASIILMFAVEGLFYYGVACLAGSVLIFLLALFLKIRIIAIEKEASKIALKYLNEVLDKEQVGLCKKFLNDARLSYWADFLNTLLAWTFMTKKNKLFG